MKTSVISGCIRPSDWNLRSVLQDLFVLTTGMALGVLVAWQYDIFTSDYVTDPPEKRIEIDEALLLGLVLCILLFVFAVRRLAEQRRAQERAQVPERPWPRQPEPVRVPPPAPEQRQRAHRPHPRPR